MPADRLPSSLPLAEEATPLRIHLEDSCSVGLRQTLTEAPGLFTESSPEHADVVIFGSDDIAYVEHSPIFRSYASKSICVTESDIPTFRLPGLYAANMKSFITSSRVKTMSYFISERERGNPEVRQLIGRQIDKRYLYSFMGGSNSWARKRLFRAVHSRKDTLIEPTDSYNHWTVDPDGAESRANQMRRYARVMAASKFTLCPRGCGLSSYRLFESMSLGIAPVIISDQWQPIEGIDWSFAIFVPERRIVQIDQIVRSHEPEWEQRGQAGRDIYTRLLAPEVVATMLHNKMVQVLTARSPAREAVMALTTRARAAKRAAYWKGYHLVKYLVLWGYHISGQPIPIRLNRPVEVQLNRAASARRGAADC
jgi:hypothetical protein